MKIIVLSSSYLPKLNGVTRTISELGNGLCSAGHSVTILTKWRAGLQREELDSCPRVRRLGGGGGAGESFLFLVYLIASTVRSSRNRGEEVIHAHGTIPAVAATVSRLLTRKKFVLTLHQDALLGWELGYNRLGGIRYAATRLCQQVLCTTASAITVQSDEVGSITRRVLKIKERQNLFVVPNPVDTSKFKPTERIAGESNSPDILFVGNLIERKGLDVLLKAMQRVLKRFPTARLIVVGKGPEQKRLVELSVALGVSKNVFFKGEVSEADLVACYDQSEIFVLPSYSEVFGIVLAEALSMGKVVVATATVGAKSVIKNGVTGILVEIGDHVGMGDAIGDLLSDNAARHTMGLAGRRLVQENFSLEAIITSLERIYAGVLRPSTPTENHHE